MAFGLVLHAGYARETRGSFSCSSETRPRCFVRANVLNKMVTKSKKQKMMMMVTEKSGASNRSDHAEEGGTWYGVDGGLVRELRRVQSEGAARVKVVPVARFSWRVDAFESGTEHDIDDGDDDRDNQDHQVAVIETKAGNDKSYDLDDNDGKRARVLGEIASAVSREGRRRDGGVCLFAELDMTDSSGYSQRGLNKRVLEKAGFEAQALAVDDEELELLNDDAKATQRFVFIPRARRAVIPFESADSLPNLATTSRGGHVCILVKDIRLSLQFYSLFGYQPVHKFVSTGLARAAWLDSTHDSFLRLELIELPAYLHTEESSSSQEHQQQQEQEGEEQQHQRGLYHVSLDVTECCVDLSAFLLQLDAQSVARFGKRMNVTSSVKQIMMGHLVAEVAFIRDPDGVSIELIRRQTTLRHEMQLGVDF